MNPDKNTGKILNDRYVLNEVIGVGGMAVVYKAYDKIIDRMVAIKILKEEFTQNSMFRKRFLNESRVISMLSHANIVDVYDVNLEGDLQYIVMEYVDGITLKQYIDKQGTLSWSEALFFTSQILNALQHAHERGIIHRDIKPHNIMLLEDGTIKVADFGIARVSKFDTVTMTEKAIGSVHYISPEQASGGKTDEKSDLYSVGVMLYEMITGSLPFEGDTPVTVALMQVQAKPKRPSEINDTIPLGLEEITLKAMCKDPENRYQTAHDMADDIEQFRKNPDILFNYDFSADEGATKVIDIVKPTEVKKKPWETALPIFLGIITAFVIFGIGVAILFVRNAASPGTATADISVPNFVGQTYEAVTANKEYAKSFKFIQGSTEWSDTYEEGVVTKQDPGADQLVKSGREITLTVSLGKKTAEVPNVKNLDQAQASTLLRNKGFTVSLKSEYSSTIESGLVIRTSPEGSTTAAYGSNVVIYVSSGEQTEKVAVPSVVDLLKDEAITKLEDAKLTSEVDHEYSDTITEGHVISQSIAANTYVNTGTKVKIIISLGKEVTSEVLTVKKIALIESTKIKTEYKVSDELSVDDMYITVTYSDASTKKVAVTESMITGFNSDKVTTEPQVLTITYEGAKDTYEITVVAATNG